MLVYSLYILNKAGGLIYQNDVNPGLNKLTANDYLVLAGTLHGVHAITSRFTSLNQHELDAQRNVPPGTTGEITSQTGPNPGTAPGSGTSGTSNANTNIISSGQAMNPNTNRTGLQSIETDHFNLYVFQTLTGVKFIMITSAVATKSLGKHELNSQLQVTNEIFKKIYISYSDYIMKDPFYSLDMPIKNVLFDSQIRQLTQ